MSFPFDTQSLRTAKPLPMAVPRPQSLLARRNARALRRTVRSL